MKKGLVLTGITAGATAVVAGMVGITMYNKKKIAEADEVIYTEEETTNKEVEETEEEVEAKISKKNKVIGAVIAGAATIGAGIGIVSATKSKKDEEQFEDSLDLKEMEWDGDTITDNEYIEEDEYVNKEYQEYINKDEAEIEEVEVEEVC